MWWEVPSSSYRAEKEAERQYRGTPRSLNNYHSHHRDLPNHSWDKQTQHCEEAETARAFIIFLCGELHVPVEATCHQMKPHTWRTRMHMCVHMQMFPIKLCLHPLQTPRLLNTGEGDYQEEEMWGLRVSEVLLSLVSSLGCKQQDLLPHWGHWAQRACKETHSEHEAHNSVCSLSAQAGLKSFLCCCFLTCRSEPRH